jgi:hypothetical protein
MLVRREVPNRLSRRAPSQSAGFGIMRRASVRCRAERNKRLTANLTANSRGAAIPMLDLTNQSCDNRA